MCRSRPPKPPRKVHAAPNNKYLDLSASRNQRFQPAPLFAKVRSHAIWETLGGKHAPNRGQSFGATFHHIRYWTTLRGMEFGPENEKRQQCLEHARVVGCPRPSTVPIGSTHRPSKLGRRRSSGWSRRPSGWSRRSSEGRRTDHAGSSGCSRQLTEPGSLRSMHACFSAIGLKTSDETT